MRWLLLIAMLSMSVGAVPKTAIVSKYVTGTGNVDFVASGYSSTPNGAIIICGKSNEADSVVDDINICRAYFDGTNLRSMCYWVEDNLSTSVAKSYYSDSLVGLTNPSDVDCFGVPSLIRGGLSVNITEHDFNAVWSVLLFFGCEIIVGDTLSPILTTPVVVDLGAGNRPAYLELTQINASFGGGYSTDAAGIGVTFGALSYNNGVESQHSVGLVIDDNSTSNIIRMRAQRDAIGAVRAGGGTIGHQWQTAATDADGFTTTALENPTGGSGAPEEQAYFVLVATDEDTASTILDSARSTVGTYDYNVGLEPQCVIGLFSGAGDEDIWFAVSGRAFGFNFLTANLDQAYVGFGCNPGTTSNTITNHSFDEQFAIHRENAYQNRGEATTILSDGWTVDFTVASRDNRGVLTGIDFADFTEPSGVGAAAAPVQWFWSWW